MRVSGEIADRKNEKKITVTHIDEAEDKIDRDRIVDIVASQPKQYQLVLQSILSLQPERKKQHFHRGNFTSCTSRCARKQTQQS